MKPTYFATTNDNGSETIVALHLVTSVSYVPEPRPVTVITMMGGDRLTVTGVKSRPVFAAITEALAHGAGDR